MVVPMPCHDSGSSWALAFKKFIMDVAKGCDIPEYPLAETVNKKIAVA
jgi:hypothetical protein